MRKAVLGTVLTSIVGAVVALIINPSVLGWGYDVVSGNRGGPSKSEFVREAAALCNDHFAAQQEIPGYPKEASDPSITSDELRRFGAYQRRAATIARPWLRAMRRIDAPNDVEDEYQEALDRYRGWADWKARAAATAARLDRRATVRAIARANGELDAGSLFFRDYGLNACA